MSAFALGLKAEAPMPLTFPEQAAELHRLEAVALSLGLSETAFEIIAKDVASHTDRTPEEMLEEIRRRVMERAQTKKAPPAGAGRA